MSSRRDHAKKWVQIEIPAETHVRMKEYKEGHPLAPSLYAIADTAINKFLDAEEVRRERGK